LESVVSAVDSSAVPLDPFPLVPAAYTCTDEPISGCFPAIALPLKVTPEKLLVAGAGVATATLAEAPQFAGVVCVSVTTLPEPPQPANPNATLAASIEAIAGVRNLET